MLKNVLLVIVAGVLLAAGCSVNRNASKDQPYEPFSITTVDRNYFNVMLRFTPVAEELNRQIKQPVHILSDWNVQSIKVHMENNPNYCSLLYLDPVEYCRINQQHPLTPVAVRVNSAGQADEAGLIVVAKKSPIKTLADLKGKRFAYGPYESSYMFFNVLEYFKSQDLAIALLKEQSYNKDSLAVAQKVLINFADAGVVTRTWWNTTKDRTLDLSKLLKEELRVIGQTQPLPEHLWATTANVKPQQREEVEKVLTQALLAKPQVLAGFGAQAFKAADPKEINAVCNRIAAIKHIPPSPIVPALP